MGRSKYDLGYAFLEQRKIINRIRDEEAAERRRLKAERARVFGTEPPLGAKGSSFLPKARTVPKTSASPAFDTVAFDTVALDEVARAQASVRARAAAAGISDRSASLQAVLKRVEQQALQRHAPRHGLSVKGRTLGTQIPVGPDPKAVARLNEREEAFAEKKHRNTRILTEMRAYHRFKRQRAAEAQVAKPPSSPRPAPRPAYPVRPAQARKALRAGFLAGGGLWDGNSRRDLKKTFLGMMKKHVMKSAKNILLRPFLSVLGEMPSSGSSGFGLGGVSRSRGK